MRGRQGTRVGNIVGIGVVEAAHSGEEGSVRQELLHSAIRVDNALHHVFHGSAVVHVPGM